MALSRQDVENIAELARLELTDAEKDMYAKQLGSILSLMDTLNEVDTSKVEPTSHVLKLENVLRDDVPYFSDTREDILANSPDRKFDFVKVKKVID